MEAKHTTPATHVGLYTKEALRQAKDLNKLLLNYSPVELITHGEHDGDDCGNLGDEPLFEGVGLWARQRLLAKFMKALDVTHCNFPNSETWGGSDRWMMRSDPVSKQELEAAIAALPAIARELDDELESYHRLLSDTWVERKDALLSKLNAYKPTTKLFLHATIDREESPIEDYFQDVDLSRAKWFDGSLRVVDNGPSVATKMDDDLIQLIMATDANSYIEEETERIMCRVTVRQLQLALK